MADISKQPLGSESPPKGVNYSIILPTYNERDNLPLVVCLITQAFKSFGTSLYEIVVVDDGSPDGTADVCRNLQKVFKPEGVQLRLLERGSKLGLGTAYLDGLSKTTGQYVILMDADLSHHPKYIPHLIALQKSSSTDIVSGSRYIPGGGVCGWDLKRILISRVANFLAQVLLNPGASDLTGSFRLYRREVLEAIMKEMTGKGYVFQMEILVRARSKGYCVAELPIKFVDRIYGTSKLGAGEVLGYAKGLLQLFWDL